VEGRLVFKNATVLRPEGGLTRECAVVIEGSSISRIDVDDAVPILPGDWHIACEGRLLAPGFIDLSAGLLNSQLSRAQGRVPSQPELASLVAHAMANAARDAVTTTFEWGMAPTDVLAEASALVGVRTFQPTQWAPERLDAVAQTTSPGPYGSLGAMPYRRAVERAEDLAPAQELACKLLQEKLGQEVGVIRSGALADVVLFDAIAVSASEAAAIRLFASTAEVVVGGRVVVHGGKLLGAIDFSTLSKRAAALLMAQ
jgi:cytosine/adenosine deaminase-related metal-dependent hydrolase